MAVAICSAPGFEVALFSAEAPHFAVIARSKDGKGDAAAVLRGLIARVGGKGGGKPELAQGGGLTGDRAEILAAARQALGTR
jgi:alanyl-tRNA synthetase